MGFEKKEWKDRVSEYPNRRTLTKADGSSEDVFVARNEGTIAEEGDGFNKENMNNLEERIATAFGVLVAENGTEFRFGVNEKGEYGFYVPNPEEEGADTFVPFRNKRKYVTYRTAGTGNNDASIDVCIYDDVILKTHGYAQGAYTDILGLATLSYSMPTWTLRFLKPVRIDGTEYQVGDTITWNYETEVEYEVVLRE